MTLKEFVEAVRAKTIEYAQERPDGYEWVQADAWVHFDRAVGQVYTVDLPSSIELVPK